MNWALGYDSRWNRDNGYDVPATCDHPGCDVDIDRGLSFQCGGPHWSGLQIGCGLHFCQSHLAEAYRGGETIKDRDGWTPNFCERCRALHAEHGLAADLSQLVPFTPKRDVLGWVEHKLDDPTWAQWRGDHPVAVDLMRKRMWDEGTGRQVIPCRRCGFPWHEHPLTWWTEEMRDAGRDDPDYSRTQDTTLTLCPPSDAEGPIPLATGPMLTSPWGFIYPAWWDDERDRLVFPAAPWWLKKIDQLPERFQTENLRALKADLDSSRGGEAARAHAEISGGAK